MTDPMMGSEPPSFQIREGNVNHQQVSFCPYRIAADSMSVSTWHTNFMSCAYAMVQTSAVTDAAKNLIGFCLRVVIWCFTAR